jgi:predicted nuclease with TOPRIM domain
VPKEQLGSRIQELLDELEKIEAADPAARDRLANVLHDIRTMVAESESESESDEHESLRERFDEAARNFEESHPTLTAVVGRVADSLANLGI